ncbi:hypothetical protein ANN_17721 [Periplaneta americana]|uniref:Reverse transcriptase domain-containing protein n=1 Tax=Periplaneta americana TaxID=6978 RepID=A0ABQ8STQ4_PERAM|nr:hypothetical protein ANN_17721 [Periplaneta americana]
MSIESVPLPDIHAAFHWFSGAKCFTTFDLNSAYHQIPLKDSRRYTAFATDWNLYEFCRVPFGIATGAQVLMCLLDSIFSDVKFKYLYHYLDDLVVYSESFEEHLSHVKEVLDRLRGAGLTVKTAKFIPKFSELAAPLNRLRKKGVKFCWDQEQEVAFLALKQAIASPSVLAMADFLKNFVLLTDACGSAVAAVLLQDFEGHLRAVAYASRTLTDQERKFSVYELEASGCYSGWRNSGCIWSIGNAVPLVHGAPPIALPVLSKVALLFQGVKEAQCRDPELGSIRESIQQGLDMAPYTLREDILCYLTKCDQKLKVVLPNELVPAVLKFYHDSPPGGYLGIYKTLVKIREQFT